MEVIFWGTRGSVPVSLNALQIRAKIRGVLKKAIDQNLGPGDDIDHFLDQKIPFCERSTYGTNTSCVEIRDGNEFILCDAGTGLRSFGDHVKRLKPNVRPREFHVFLSHLHWDHIQGFPFFAPALFPKNTITFYGCHPDLEKAFRLQQSAPFFPLDLSSLKSEIYFETLVPGATFKIAGFEVTPQEQNHPGISFGYRFERSGKTVVYSTDSQHKHGQDTSSYTAFIHGADLLIFDAQYTFAEACTVRENWGHSDNLTALKMAHKARVKHLLLFHHDPGRSDSELDSLLEDTRKQACRFNEGEPLRVTMAWDGLVVEI
jgi:phosphoribosyl 1,2-cyclic phosphodiesterase